VDAAAPFSVGQLAAEVITPGDEPYDRARRVWNGLFDRRPAAIVRARTVDDVRRTIALAGESGLALAVRGGGHSLPGFSACDRGVVLDLSRMNAISVEPSARVATVAGGALLGDLDRAGARHGLVTPAGVVSHTGAAGLTLGGGMGWLSRRLGLTIDSLLAAEVCTADGRVLGVSADEEPELFWGLRGGGGNFGVVTRFTFQMHELGPIAIGTWDYPAALARDVLRRFAGVSEEAPRELTAAFTITQAGVSVSGFHSGPTASMDTLAGFGQLGAPSAGGIQGVSFVDLQRRYDEHFAWGRRYYAKGCFLATLDTATIDRLADAAAAAPTPDCEVYVLALGGAVRDVPDGATAYTGREAAYYCLVEAVWDDPGDDAVGVAWGRATVAAVSEAAIAGNYVNEQSDIGTAVALDAYGGDTYQRLTELKERFDPTNLFRLNQNVTPHGASEKRSATTQVGASVRDSTTQSVTARAPSTP
jgi:FAD/FMN-containing dehydrogenase